ncbi:MAG: ERF family protein [Oleispira sp.]
MSINKELARIQQELKAPKSQYNKHGKFWFRNCEDILEGLKPHLNGLTVIVRDELVVIGSRFYVKATATLSDGENEISSTAYAREAEDQKGMQSAQLSGSTSSYARKYALNGLFLIDDSKDADSQDTNGNPATFQMDEIAQGWIASVKQDNTVLDQINDPAYKAFIKTNAGI